jgi:hypothetical protein
VHMTMNDKVTWCIARCHCIHSSKSQLVLGMQTTPHVFLICVIYLLLTCWHSPFQRWGPHLNQNHHRRSHTCQPSFLNDFYVKVHNFTRFTITLKRPNMLLTKEIFDCLHKQAYNFFVSYGNNVWGVKGLPLSILITFLKSWFLVAQQKM